MAYSTWRRRPCGLQTVTSVSYWLRNMVAVAAAAGAAAGG